MPLILVMLTSHCDSDFERSHISFNENIKMGGTDGITLVVEEC